MHYLVQEMGWAIVREQCIIEPGNCSRLFIAENIYHLLKNNIIRAAKNKEIKKIPCTCYEKTARENSFTINNM
ncbi:unnamed protein product [Malus baccata var. baccata]|uniref:Uncharacterized protein n=1 Tax=Malus domestica TaxID=3750 RepID=A0A498J2S4_MALDO|nr:hypothetical protein DVH24_034651 [Malus domestica]